MSFGETWKTFSHRKARPMPRPKTACLDCGALCYSYGLLWCKECFDRRRDADKAMKQSRPSTSWWVNVPREQFSKVVQAQRGRMESAS